MKKQIYIMIAVFLVALVSCGNNDRELKEIVRMMNNDRKYIEILRMLDEGMWAFGFNYGI